MDKCEICENEDFISEGGFFFCSSCGNQSQQEKEAIFVSEAIESSQVALPSAVKAQDSSQPEEEQLSIIDKFQKILVMQCDALISLGCDHSVTEAIKLVWFRFLHYSGYAFENVELTPLTQTMHGDLPKSKLRFKKNKRVCSTPALRPIPLIPVHTAEGRVPKRSLSLSTAPGPPSLTPDGTTSEDSSDSDTLLDSDSKMSSPSRKKRRKLKTPKTDSEASQVSRDTARQEDDAMAIDVDSSQKEPVSDFVDISSSLELFGEENKQSEMKPFSLGQPVNEVPDFASFFDNSSSEDGDNVGGGSAERSKEETDQYHMSLKRQLGSSHMRVLTLKHTLAICYLGLLYTEQNILLSDFARWVDINKVPYYNVLGLLPESCRKGKMANMFRPKARDVTADNLYVLLRYFCWYLPLPPLPTIKASTMCQILIEKLHLPNSFNKMTEKLLRCIDKPKFDGVFMHTHRTFDIECMAVIVYLVRMIYSLNDIIEFDMVELVREEEDCSGDYIYLYEDWIALYSKIKINNLSKSVPTCKSDLAFLTSPKNFVDYCFEMFKLSLHSNPTDVDPDTNQPVDPSDHDDILNTLKKAQAKTKKWSPQEPSNVQLKLPTPRRIYISDLKASPFSAWNHSGELHRDSKKNRFHEIELSHSFRFLLQTCCEILDVPATELYDSVCSVDSQVTRTSMALKKFYSTLHKKKVEPKKKRQSQHTQTEDALFLFLSFPPEDESFVGDNDRILRPRILVPENTNADICIPVLHRKYDKIVQTDNDKIFPPLSLLSKCTHPNDKFNRALLQARLNPPDSERLMCVSNNPPDSERLMCVTNNPPDSDGTSSNNTSVITTSDSEYSVMDSLSSD